LPGRQVVCQFGFGRGPQLVLGGVVVQFLGELAVEVIRLAARERNARPGAIPPAEITPNRFET